MLVELGEIIIFVIYIGKHNNIYYIPYGLPYFFTLNYQCMNKLILSDLGFISVYILPVIVY